MSEQRAPLPDTSRKAFFETDFKALDRNLSPAQQEEWNRIYASYQSKSILSGTVIGLDQIQAPMQGQLQPVTCLVIVEYRVKVLIPEMLVWSGDTANARYVLGGMVGATVDYIVNAVDREADCVVASRAAAAEQQRWHALHILRVKAGDIAPCTVLAVGANRLTATMHGYDVTLSQAGLSHSFLGDLRESYHPGQALQAKVLDISPDTLSLSVRDAMPDPYIGAEMRHPVGCTRMATITGKYAGGIFAHLPDGCTVICKYAQQFSDDQFQMGDRVVVQIQQFRDERRWLRGKIRARLG